MIVLNGIQFSLAILVIILSGLRFIGLLKMYFRRDEVLTFSETDRCYAIIVLPAKDKNNISKSLYSLFALAYPRKMYDIILCNDCFSEEAVRTASGMGGIIIEGRKKPEVLLEEIMAKPKDYDAVVIIESDNLVSGNYLNVLNYYLDHGSKLIQSNSLKLPRKDKSWNVIQQFFFSIKNMLKPIERRSMGTKGGGLCFSMEALLQYVKLLPSRQKHTDYRLWLSQAQVKVDFITEAIVWRQHNSGYLDGRSRKMNRKPYFRKYLFAILRMAFQQKSVSHLKAALRIIKPSVLELFLFPVLMITLSLIGWEMAEESLTFVWIWVTAGLLGLTNILLNGKLINTYYKAYKSIL